VRPEDVRRTFERSIELNGPGSYYTDIVGATSCLKHMQRKCDLPSGIVTDKASNTVTFHLVAPDPDLLAKLALPFAMVVPVSTPTTIPITQPVPGTGPYKVIRRIPGHEVVLVRNPYFRVWSPDARPAGYPDRIEIRILGGIKGTSHSDADAARAVEHGHADLDWFTSLSPSLAHELSSRYPQLLRVSFLGGTSGIALNTRLPPFNDLRVRQALNYAVDRRAVVRLLGGPVFAQPTCQSMPPNLPSYRPYCPYTLDHSPDGPPNLARARELVRQSRTQGSKVVVYSGSPAAQYLVQVLNKLGYHAATSSLAPLTKTGALQKGVQATNWGWAPDWPAPDAMIEPQFTCAAHDPVSQLCNRAIDGAVSEATREQTSNPDQANQTWTSIDRAVTNQAPWVFLTNKLNADVVSERVGNYMYNPEIGELIDQLWVR
jgi:peptide/nickel transport system substrate-binding protein